MQQSQFIKIKMNAVTNPQFKDLAGLQESGSTATLIEFVTMLHPNCMKEAQGTRLKCITTRDHYNFTIYGNVIIKSWHVGNTLKRTLFRLS